MKHSCIVLILFSFILPHSIQAQTASKECTELADNFMAAVKSMNINDFAELKPTAEMWRVISPEETKDKTDEEILKEFSNNGRLQFAFNNIMQSAKDHHIDLNKLHYTGCYYEKLGNTPVAVSVYFSYEDKKGEFHFSVVGYNYKLYLDDIKNSYQIFDHLE